MRVFKLVMIIPLLSMLFSKAQAQGKFGATEQDSIECIKNLNFYQEEYRKKDYKAAYAPWREALRLCPKSSQNLYIRGSNIMREQIRTINDPAKKKQAVDSLLMLYDKQMEYFKVSKAEILYRKADVIEEYYPQNHKEVFDAYLAAINADKANGQLISAAKAMIEAKVMYENNQIDAEKFADIYTTLSEIADQRIKTKINDSIALNDAQSAKAAIENAFISTDAATCENLIRLFTPRFEANPNDLTTVGSIIYILTSRECTQNDLFYRAAEAYYKLDPSPKSANTLAIMFHAKGELDKAIPYYKDAIDGQTDMIEKSNYQIALASIYLQQGQSGQASTLARQAMTSNPKNGRAYIILAANYANIKNCGSDPVSQRSVFWVAYDLLQKAKQVESNPKILEEINKQMNLYRQHFPSYDDCFDLDILDGQTYTVSCGGINERTIVRTRK